VKFKRYIDKEISSITRLKLENGVTILTQEDSSPGVVSIGCFMRMGSLYEEESSAGLTNLLQALMLKGTKKLDSYMLARELESLGARTASSSGKELGRISMITISDNFEPSLNLFMEIITEPLLSEEEFDKERQIAIEEIKRDKDQYLSRAFTLFQEAFYGGHPFRKNVLGYEDTIGSTTLEDVKRYYKRFYNPANLVFSVVGKADVNKLVSVIEQYTAGIIDRKSQDAHAGPSKDEKDDILSEYRESEAAWIVVGFPAPSLDDERQAACQVLNAILGGSMNSRLFIELREKKALAYQVSAAYNCYIGPSFIAGYIGTSASRSEEAKNSLGDEMMKIATDGVSTEEVNGSINYLIGSYMINSELSSALARRYGRFEALGVGYDYGARYLESLTDVSPENVREVAGEFFKDPVYGAVLPKVLESKD
jgi:predicted Zn-dependent peptidase